MKKYMLIFFSMFAIGIAIIFLPNAVERQNTKLVEQKNLKQQKTQNENIQQISSSLETIENPEIDLSDREPELFNKNQIYFENIDMLYEYLKINNIEKIKERIQFYIHQNIDPSIGECKIMPESILHGKNRIIFILEAASKKIEVEAIFSDQDDIEKIIIRSIV